MWNSGRLVSIRPTVSPLPTPSAASSASLARTRRSHSHQGTVTASPGVRSTTASGEEATNSWNASHNVAWDSSNGAGAFIGTLREGGVYDIRTLPRLLAGDQQPSLHRYAGSGSRAGTGQPAEAMVQVHQRIARAHAGADHLADQQHVVAGRDGVHRPALEAHGDVGEQRHVVETALHGHAVEVVGGIGGEAVRQVLLPLAQHVHGERVRGGEHRGAAGGALQADGHQRRPRRHLGHRAGREAPPPAAAVGGGDDGQAGRPVGHGVADRDRIHGAGGDHDATAAPCGTGCGSSTSRWVAPIRAASRAAAAGSGLANRTWVAPAARPAPRWSSRCDGSAFSTTDRAPSPSPAAAAYARTFNWWWVSRSSPVTTACSFSSRSRGST